MTSEQFESMMEGLNEVLEYAKGDTTKCRVRVVEIPDLKVNPLPQYNKDEADQFHRLIDDIRAENQEKGFLSDDEVNKEIQAYRKEQNTSKKTANMPFFLFSYSITITIHTIHVICVYCDYFLYYV